MKTKSPTPTIDFLNDLVEDLVKKGCKPTEIIVSKTNADRLRAEANKMAAGIVKTTADRRGTKLFTKVGPLPITVVKPGDRDYLEYGVRFEEAS